MSTCFVWHKQLPLPDGRETTGTTAVARSPPGRTTPRREQRHNVQHRGVQAKPLGIGKICATSLFANGLFYSRTSRKACTHMTFIG